MAFGWKSMFLLWVVTTNYIGCHFTGLFLFLLCGPRWRLINGIMKSSVIAHNGPAAGRGADDGLTLFNLSLICSLSDTGRLPLITHWYSPLSLSLSLSHKNKPFLPSLNTIMAISGHGEIWPGVVTSQGGILHSAVMWDKPRTPTSYLLPPESLFVFVIFGVI